MLPFLFLLAAATTSFLPLHRYEGTWTISGAHTMAGPGKVDVLTNDCAEHTAFYTCQQVVNGKPMALMIFTPTDDPKHFHTQPVLPDGHAVGRSDLTLDGDHWTFLGSSTDDAGKPVWYRTENYFTGVDKIHFDQFESPDNKTWVKKNEGDEVRTASH